MAIAITYAYDVIEGEGCYQPNYFLIAITYVYVIEGEGCYQPNYFLMAITYTYVIEGEGCYSVYRTIIVCDKWISVWILASCDKSPYPHTYPLITQDDVRYTLYYTTTNLCVC